MTDRHDNQAGAFSEAKQPVPVVAFLQARMGSQRLPGKVLMRLHGQSILERAIRRIQAAAVVNAVIVLTTRRKEDDAIVSECTRLNVPFFRGPDEDVLLRFYEASKVFQPEIVIRATADNPLIDIGSVDRIVEALHSQKGDICVEQGLPYGAATEALTADILEKAHHWAIEPGHREHVTLYLWEHPEQCRQIRLTPPDTVRHPEIRVTVDTPDDFRYADYLIGSVAEGVNPPPLEVYLAAALQGRTKRELRQ